MPELLDLLFIGVQYIVIIKGSGLKITVFWDVVQRSLVDTVPTFQRNLLPLTSEFIPEDMESRSIFNVGIYLPTYTASYRRGL
jgi:hypothetical protein